MKQRDKDRDIQRERQRVEYEDRDMVRESKQASVKKITYLLIDGQKQLKPLKPFFFHFY